MKKRAADDALSDAVKDEPAFDSIMCALEADPVLLLARLRAGIASNAEQALAADLIEGKKKPKQPKGLPWYQRRELALVMVTMDQAYPYGHPRGQRQSAIEETVKYAKGSGYKVSRRYLYKMLAEFDPQVLAKIKALRARPMRTTKRIPGGKDTINVDGKLVEIMRGECEMHEPTFDVRYIDHDNLVLLVESLLAPK